MTCARLLAMGALALGLRAPAAAQQVVSPEALAAAEQALVTARAEKEAAYASLESLVSDLADDFAALTSDVDAPARRRALVLAMHDALPAAQARLAAEAAKGRAVMKGTRRQLLLEAFSEPVATAAPVDPRFAAFLARRVAEALSPREDFIGITDEHILQAMDAALPADKSWYVFWNDTFHLGLPEADAWRAAQEKYEAEGVRLDRLRNPERYGRKGEVAPPGMVIVPGGSYDLGPNTGWERPAHKAKLEVFAIDRHECTQGEYALFVNALPLERRQDLLPRGWDLGAEGLVLVPDERRGLPVMHVNWSQAAEYAAWAGKRLPTEEEWEAAAAGVDGRPYPWGSEFRPGLCHGAENARAPLPVESFPHAPAPCGALDLSGNVWEWTSTLEDGTDMKEGLPEGLVNVVIRGGAFDSRRDELTTRYRWTAPGHDAFASARYIRPIGFRCVKDL